MEITNFTRIKLLLEHFYQTLRRPPCNAVALNRSHIVIIYHSMAYRPEYRASSDEELVRLFQTGSADIRGQVDDLSSGRATRDAAFTEILERYQKKIYYAARKMAHGDHDEADEIAQETFVKAYEALASFRIESKLYTWLYRIMMNAAIQRSRRVKARPKVDLESIRELGAEGIQPEDDLLKSETTRLIESAIETLPPKQQRVFMLRFYEEMPYEDIAEILGTSVGGLKANYFHAVRKIGDYLHAQERVINMEGLAGLAEEF